MEVVLKEVLDCLDHALKNKSYDYALTDEIAFFQIVQENGLSALIHQAINPSKISKTLYQSLEREFLVYLAADTKQLEVMEHLKHIFNHADIPFIFLKGSMMKALYPASYLRGMGDIDILIHSEDMEKAHIVLANHQIYCKQKSKQHDLFLTKDNIIIEVHPGLYKDFNTKFEKLFSNPWQYTNKLMLMQYQFDATFEIVYLVYHLAKHMESSGIGLRSILDLGIYLKNHEAELNETRLESFLDQANMKTFYITMIEMTRTFFHFNFQLAIHHISVLSDDEKDDLLTYISSSGLHGHGRRFNTFEARAASYHLRNKTRFQMMIDIVFPNYETMLGIYPWIKKAKILIIIAWLIRWIEMLTKKRK